MTLSFGRDAALAGPGYGFVGAPAAAGWTASQTERADMYRSERIVATVDKDLLPSHPPVQTQVDISKYFNGSAPGAHITLRTPEGKKLLEMTGWSQGVPNQKEGTADLARDRRSTDPEFYVVGATFASPDDEHYYGLGQNHEGFLDHRGHPVHCWQGCTSPRGPSRCVPFLVTNKGCGLVWDNPSKTTIEPGFNEQTRWTSEEGGPGFVFCDRGRNGGRDLCGVPIAYGAHADAAQGGLWLHSVQAALCEPGRMTLNRTGDRKLDGAIQIQP